VTCQSEIGNVPDFLKYKKHNHFSLLFPSFFVGIKRLQNAQPHGFTVCSQKELGDISPTSSAVAITDHCLPPAPKHIFSSAIFILINDSIFVL